MGAGEQECTGVALPARVPPVRPRSARAIVVRCGFLSGSVALARRLGEARRPGSGVGVVLDLGPLRSAAFVRASFSARRGVRLGCRICSVRPMRAGFSGTCGVRRGGGAGSLRSVRPLGRSEVFDAVRGNESLHSRSRSAAFKRASFLEREVFDSAPGNRGRSILGAGSWSRSARWPSCGRSFSAREVFDSAPANGSLHLVADPEVAPLEGGPAAGWRQRHCCPARTAGAGRTASRQRRPCR